MAKARWLQGKIRKGYLSPQSDLPSTVFREILPQCMPSTLLFVAPYICIVSYITVQGAKPDAGNTI